MSRARHLWLPAVLLALTACTDELPIDPDDPNEPGDTLPPGGIRLTSEQRMTALDAVQARVLTLAGQDFAADTRALVEDIRSRPEFEAAGSSADGTVWGAFKDGTLVFVVYGGPPDTAAPPAPRGPSTPDRVGAAMGPVDPGTATPPAGGTRPRLAAGQRPAAAAVAANAAAVSRMHQGTVPASARFRLLNAMGSYFQATDPRAQVQAMLTATGYTGGQQDATLDVLRTVAGDWIFYYRGHGGMGSVNRSGATQDFYALWTATPAVNASREASDAVLLQDLRLNRVVYMLFRDSRWNIAFRGLPQDRHYGITDKFVEHYMSFEKNSLVYIDACDGAYHAFFRDAFKDASVFVGWNERAAFSAMDRTAKYVFDRLLGANRFAPETPHQRPFGYEALAADPKFGAGRTYGTSSWLAQDGGTIVAQLGIYHLRDDFGILAPSIAAMRADKQTDELHIFGEFGPDPRAAGLPATVSIENGSGGVSLAITQWQPNWIIADLPSTGPNSSGDVVVRIRDHRSNPRRLVAWRGKLHYTWKEQGTLTYTVDMDLHARADPGLYREEPAEAPKPHPGTDVFEIEIPETAVASWAASGSHSFTDPSGCTITTTWNGAASITAAETQLGLFAGLGKIDLVARRLTLNLGFGVNEGHTVTTTAQCPGGGGGTFTQPGPVFLWQGVYDDPSRLLIYFTVDDEAHIQADSRTRTAGPATATLQWSLISAQPPYDGTLVQ